METLNDGISYGYGIQSSHSTQVRWRLAIYDTDDGRLRLFTFHTGQMETTQNFKRGNNRSKFTFHTGQMETKRAISKFFFKYRFTFHTGQMETLESIIYKGNTGKVHIPHRSDGDLYLNMSSLLVLWVHIPHRSDGDGIPHAGWIGAAFVHIPHRSDGDRRD